VFYLVETSPRVGQASPFGRVDPVWSGLAPTSALSTDHLPSLGLPNLSIPLIPKSVQIELDTRLPARGSASDERAECRMGE
jgi:hypothetical protein